LSILLEITQLPMLTLPSAQAFSVSLLVINFHKKTVERDEKRDRRERSKEGKKERKK